MKLGFKALSPFFISSPEEHAKYFDIGCSHFIESCEQLDIDSSKWKDIRRTTREKVEKSQDLNKQEQLLAGSIGYGDVYWFQGCSSWSNSNLRFLGNLMNPLVKFRMERKIRKYVKIDVPKPDYSSPRDFDTFSQKDLKNVRATTVLHLEWFKYLLNNLDMDYSINFREAKYETLNYFINGETMSREHRELQKVLSENDIKWVSAMASQFNYETFWLKSAKKYLENTCSEF